VTPKTSSSLERREASRMTSSPAAAAGEAADVVMVGNQTSSAGVVRAGWTAEVWMPSPVEVLGH